MLPIMANELLQRLSCYNSEYYCIIDRVEFSPGIIRVHFDIRGSNSLGSLQDPLASRLGIVEDYSLSEIKLPTNGNFFISDETRQYTGYLDFPLDSNFLTGAHDIGFEYGASGYSTATLFHIDEKLIEKYQIKLA